MNPEELKPIPEEQILSMDGTEPWFARFMQPKPWKHWREASSKGFWCHNCNANLIEGGDPDSDMMLSWTTKSCTVPPAITEPLEVLAFRLANEAWPGVDFRGIAVRVDTITRETKDYDSFRCFPGFSAKTIIKASLIAIKRGKR